ncbi:MAG TPA: acyltransferase [Thermomicrobiales bacterium]|nr:acyltransferase [Thermomicrobiales bacterium]
MTPSPAPAAAGRESARLGFLDALRGVAVLAVVGVHVAGLLFADYGRVVETRFALGHFGVTLFFLCSGFVIPVSLERQGSLRRFWTRRFFRLYPAYWYSLALAMMLTAVGYAALPDAFRAAPGATFAANATMLQGFVGMPNAVGTYWTLAFEMLFYGLVSLLFLLRLHRRVVPLTAALFLAPVCTKTVLPLLRGTSSGSDLHGLIFTLGSMFLGTVVYRCYRREGTFPAALAVALCAPLAVFVMLSPHFLVRVPASAGGLPFAPWFNGWIAAYAVFVAAVAAHRLDFPRPIRGLGTISYSLYLLHPLVVGAVPRVGNWLATGALWLALCLALATLSYRWIEAPAIRLGHRLTSAGRGARRAEPIVALAVAAPVASQAGERS